MLGLRFFRQVIRRESVIGAAAAFVIDSPFTPLTDTSFYQ